MSKGTSPEVSISYLLVQKLSVFIYTYKASAVTVMSRHILLTKLWFAFSCLAAMTSALLGNVGQFNVGSRHQNSRFSDSFNGPKGLSLAIN